MLCNLGRSLSGNTEVEDIPHHRSGFRIRHHVPLRICRVFHISVAGSGCDSGARFSFEPNHGAALLTAVLCVELVHEIPEGREVVGGLIQTVHAIVDCDEAHTVAGEDEFGVLTHLKILTAQTGQILDDECFHLTVFHQLHDLLPTGSIEVGAGVSIVRQEEGVCEALVCSIPFQ